MISLALCYEPTSNDGAAGGERPLLVIAERWGATAGGTGALLARPKLRSVGGLLMYAKASAFANVAQAVAVIAPLQQRRPLPSSGCAPGTHAPGAGAGDGGVGADRHCVVRSAPRGGVVGACTSDTPTPVPLSSTDAIGSASAGAHTSPGTLRCTTA